MKSGRLFLRGDGFVHPVADRIPEPRAWSASAPAAAPAVVRAHRFLGREAQVIGNVSRATEETLCGATEMIRANALQLSDFPAFIAETSNQLRNRGLVVFRYFHRLRYAETQTHRA